MLLAFCAHKCECVFHLMNKNFCDQNAPSLSLKCILSVKFSISERGTMYGFHSQQELSVTKMHLSRHIIHIIHNTSLITVT